MLQTRPNLRTSLSLGVLPLGAAGLALAFSGPADSIEFAPEAGTTLTKTFVTSGAFSLDDFSMTMNGEEFDPAMMGADVDLDDVSAEGSYTLTVTDEYVSVADGRPTELVRTYDALSGEFEAGTGESGGEDVEEIEGSVIRFTWNEDAGGYDRSVEEAPEDVEEEDIAMLAEDLDMRALLPTRAVSADDSWTVGFDELGSMVIPGMDLDAAMARAQEEAGDELPFDLGGQFEGMFGDTSITCTYRGVRDAGGVEVAVIDMSSEVEGSVDLTDILMAAAEEEMGDMGMEMDISVVIDFSFELEGELLWNPRAGHLHSMEFDAEAAMDVVGEMFMDMMGEEMDITFNAEFSGEMRREVSHD